MRSRFNIRDVFLLTAVIALGVMWYLSHAERDDLRSQIERNSAELTKLRAEIEQDSAELNQLRLKTAMTSTAMLLPQSSIHVPRGLTVSSTPLWTAAPVKPSAFKMSPTAIPTEVVSQPLWNTAASHTIPKPYGLPSVGR
jgi:hypothetical protein